MSVEKVLVLAPHTDDAELGCGGTINRLAEEGATIHCIIFSTCEESVPKEFPPNALEEESKIASQVVGIPAENLHINKYPVRRFNEFRQDILEQLIKTKKA